MCTSTEILNEIKTFIYEGCSLLVAHRRSSPMFESESIRAPNRGSHRKLRPAGAEYELYDDLPVLRIFRIAITP